MDCDEVKNLQSKKICDFVVFAQKIQNSWTVPIEPKRRKFKPSHVAQQLQDEIEIVTGWINFKSSYKVVPLLFRGKHVRIHPEDLGKLNR